MKILIRILKRTSSQSNDYSQRGFTLVEILVSIALLAIIGIGFAGTLNTSSKALVTTDERETAKNIAEMEMEYLKSQTYADQSAVPSEGYAARSLPAEYSDYSVVTGGDGKIYAQDAADHPDDHNIQKIEITIKHLDKEVLTITGYKTR